jgi:hypothetical protein
MFKEKFGNHTRKTFSTVTTKDNYTRNTTYKTESTAVGNWKPERWGSPLVREEECQGEKACDKTQQHNNDNNNIEQEELRKTIKTLASIAGSPGRNTNTRPSENFAATFDAR